MNSRPDGADPAVPLLYWRGGEATMHDEMLDIVNERGEVIGQATRREIHSDNSLLHRVVHLLLLNSRGEILLQKRSPSKDTAPGRWDTSVGGHVNRGEGIEEAVLRETREELLIDDCRPEFIYSYIHRNEMESELVHTFMAVYDGEPGYNPAEITEVRFWKPEEIHSLIDTGIFSNNFVDEFRRFMAFAAGREGRRQ